jgi:hypothetical protein
VPPDNGAKADFRNLPAGAAEFAIFHALLLWEFNRLLSNKVSTSDAREADLF